MTGKREEITDEIRPDLLVKIEFVGHVSDGELIDLYKNAFLFVFPSFFEGYGLPPLEAMACGCPTVVSTAACLPEVCGDAAYFVNPLDIEEMAHGLYRVSTDTDLRKTLIQRGLDRARSFTMDRFGGEHVKLLEDVIGQ